MRNFLESNMRIDASRTDIRFNLSLAGILELMEDAQTMHTGEMKVDAPHLMKNDSAFWVITRNYIHINRLPRWEENVVVGTYPLKPSAIRSERQNYIKDTDGNILVCGKAEWCALDCNTRKIRPFNTLKTYPRELVHKDERLFVPSYNLPAADFKESDFVYERLIRTTDLDFNHHVNNVKYANYIVDCFPSDFWENNAVSDLRLDYINECKEGEIMKFYMTSDQKIMRFAGKTAEKTIFTAAIILK